jgi:hypothetical protein
VGGIAVDATSVYWTCPPATGLAGPGTVTKCAIGGCGGTPTDLFSGQGIPYRIAVDATSVYWTDFWDAAVVKCPTSGCPSNQPIVLASGQANTQAIAVDATSVYWSNAPNGNPVTIMKCAIGGCSGNPTVLGSGQDYGWNIAVDAMNVYWTDSPGIPNQNDGAVVKCAIGGCGMSPSAVASGQERPTNIAVDAQNVYWDRGEPSGASLVKCAIGGCDGNPTVLTALATDMGVGRLVADGKHVYWTYEGHFDQTGYTYTSRHDGTVMKCAIGGCGGSPTVLASNLGAPTDIAVDATSVYWINTQDATVQMTAK